MMPHFSPSTIILLIIAALLLFGPNRLPELGRAVGKTFREFKNGTKELLAEDEVKVQEVKYQTITETKPEPLPDSKS